MYTLDDIELQVWAFREELKRLRPGSAEHVVLERDLNLLTAILTEEDDATSERKN